MFTLKPGFEYFVKTTNSWAGAEVAEYSAPCGTNPQDAEKYFRSVIATLLANGFRTGGCKPSATIACCYKGDVHYWIEICQQEQSETPEIALKDGIKITSSGNLFYTSLSEAEDAARAGKTIYLKGFRDEVHAAEVAALFTKSANVKASHGFMLGSEAKRQGVPYEPNFPGSDWCRTFNIHFRISLINEKTGLINEAGQRRVTSFFKTIKSKLIA
jgi:hypothetical protein